VLTLLLPGLQISLLLLRQQNPRVRNDHPRDGYPLLLSARQQKAAFADHRIVPKQQLLNERVRIRFNAGFQDQSDTSESPTRVSLDTCCDFASADVVKEGDVLAQHGPEIPLSDPFGVDLSGVDLNAHVDVSAHKHADTLCAYEGMTLKETLIGIRTNIGQIA
jgi:hypothetical protein